MAITKKEFELIEKRMEALNEHFRLVSIGGLIPNLSKDKILKHLKEKDEIGKVIAEHQFYYLRKLKERRWLTNLLKKT